MTWYLSSGSSITAPTKFIICHIVSNSVGFCQQHSIWTLESWNFTQRKLLEKIRLLVCLSKHKVLGHSQLGPTVLGSNQGFEGPEIVRIGVKRLEIKKDKTSWKIVWPKVLTNSWNDSFIFREILTPATMLAAVVEKKDPKSVSENHTSSSTAQLSNVVVRVLVCGQTDSYFVTSGNV